MAIYRTGQASMDADGYITGYGTKWKTALTLIRPGATIVFASNPVAYATISEIMNDTSMRATSTGGAVVPKGDYVILLHDSLTVDGLAQDVAETLRYYQGKETMYEQFVEFLKNFDWERMEQLGEKVYSDAMAAEASANAAKASETNANASKNAAAGSATTASQKATEAANSAGAARTSETNANASKTAAANSATAAANSATTAGQHKDAAAASASAARTSEGNASSSKNAAAASASAAKTSETNAKASETSATASKNAAKTSEDNAAASKNAAASSASAAAGSATSASNSAATAKSEADRAAELARQLDATNLMRKDANLSDVVNKGAARENLQVDRLVQGSTVTTVGKSGGNRIAVNDGGEWGALDSGNNWIALGVGKGGTGARDAAGARENLGIGERATVKHGNVQLESSAANPLLLKSINPCIKFEETDPREGGASSYYLVMDGGNIRMQENDTGSGDTVFEYIANTNTMKLPKAEFRDKAGTRNNLELGTANTVTFSQVRAPNGMICTTESNSTNDNPSAPLVMQIRASDKSTILGQAEFRADRNGALSIINRTVPSSPKFFTIQSTGEVNPPGEIVSNLGATFSSMEIGRKNANTSAYIDFHYGAKYDYDARIICDGMNSDRVRGGNLRFFSGYIEMNTISRPTVREYGLSVIGNGASVIMQPKDDAQTCYLLGRDYNANNQWFVGRGDGNANVSLYSYQTGTGLQVRSGDVYVNKDLTSQGNMVCNGSSIYVDGGSGTSNTHLWLRNSSKRNRAVIYSSDTQVLQLRSDNAGTGAGGQALSIYGATGECKAVKFTATSDERAKFWIKPVTGALDKICSLRGVTYSMHTTIQNTVRNAGVIAQDVQKVLPEAVSVNNEGQTLDKQCRQVENALSLDYNALSALYVEAFKEMRDLIEAQKAEIESLKSAVASLQASTLI